MVSDGSFWAAICCNLLSVVALSFGTSVSFKVLAGYGGYTYNSA